jgi:3'(2'), 5'-bisphosphate nucleotidase
MKNIEQPLSFDKIPSLLELVGKKLIEWRDDLEAKTIHSEKDFKTEADLRTHLMICERLTELYSDIPIISEEDYTHSEKRPDEYWLIDPIDGTSSWYNGFDGFVTQVAYIKNNIPLYGAIHAPVLEKTWTAQKNYGAYLNGKKLPKLKENNSFILADNTAEAHGIAKKVMQLLPITDYIECGSLGLKSVLVADGTIDVFVKDVCVRDWDLAPVAVILGEVNGYLIQANHAPYIFNGPYLKDNGFIVARDKVILHRVLDIFNTAKGK